MGKLLNTLVSLTRPDRAFGMANLSMPAERDSFDDDDDTPKGKIYDPTFTPKNGWDAWCEWAAEQGKIARVAQSLAKNTMCFTLKGKDPNVQSTVSTLQRRTHLRTRLIDAAHHRLVYGRTFLEPVWEVTKDSKKKVDLVKINRLWPPSVRIFRDTEQDIKDLKDFLKNETEHTQYLKALSAGAGNSIIGYVQYWERRNPDQKKNGAVFFRPEELIYIPRHPSNRCPDGVSLLRQNYVIIMNKLGVEKDQAIMAKRHGDPKLKYTIPHDLWHERENLKKELARGVRAGLDFFLKGRQRNDGSDPMNVDIVEPRGNPAAVIRAQEHIESQFIAAMGFADSFTESDSSNKSVGTIQLAFFEREIEPDRQAIAEVLEDQLLAPYLRAKGLAEDAAWIEYVDLTPEDRIEKAQIMAPLIPYMPASVVKQFLEEMGYQLEEGEEGEIQQGFARQAAQQTEVLNRLADVLADMRNTLQSTDLTTQKGVPKPVLQSAKSAREQFKDEIEAMREDVEDVLGL